MSVGHMARLWAVVGGMALAVVGCGDCGKPVDDCTDLTVEWVAPKDGEAVTSPLQVQVAGRTRTGAAFAVESGRLETRLASATDFGAPVTGTAEGAVVTFADVALPAGDNVLRATVKQRNSTCEVVSGLITVQVQDTTQPPTVTAVAFPQDADTNGILNNVELPVGTGIQLRATFANAVGGEATVLDSTDQPLSQPQTVAGTAPLTFTLPESANGYTNLFVRVTRGTATNTRTGNPAALGSIAVDRTAPSCAITSPAVRVVGPRDDADTSAAGYQIRAAGTVNAEATSVLFRLTGGASPLTSGSLTPNNNVASYDFTVGTTGSTAYTLVMEARDVVGNVCTTSVPVTADFEPPVVTITAPLASGGPLTTFAANATVTVQGADGQQVQFSAIGPSPSTTERQLGSATIAAGAAQATITFPANGTFTLVARATDTAGNEGTDTEPGLVVASTLCALRFDRPATNPAFIPGGQAPGGNYRFDLFSANCPNTAVTLKRGTTQVGAGTTSGTGAVSLTVPVTDGQYTFEGCITNPGTAAPTCVQLDVEIRLQAPSISVPNPTSPALNTAVDGNPALAGVQYTMIFNAQIPTGGRAVVCSDQLPRPGTAVDCPNGQTGWWVLKDNAVANDSAFTYPDGTYNIVVVVVANGGVTDTSAPVQINADSVRPCVAASSMSFPQDGAGADAGVGDARLNIAELGSNAPQVQYTIGCGDTVASIASVVVKSVGASYATQCPGTSVSMSVAGAPTALQNTVQLTQNVTATEADYVVAVELTDWLGNKNVICAPTANAPLDAAAVKPVRVDKARPACAIAQPSAAGPFGIADVPSGNLSVTVATANDVGTGGVQLSMPGATPATQTVAASGGTANATFAVTGTNTYTLTASCTDESGNAAAAPATKTMTIDLEAPTCSITAPTATTYSVNDILTTIVVTGADGAIATIRSSFQVPPLGTMTVPTGGPPGPRTVSQTMTYPNGTQTVSVGVADSAGNACTAAVANVVVNSSACNLLMTSTFANANAAWHNRQNTTPVTGTTGTATVTANSSNCRAGESVTLRRTAPTTVDVDTRTTDASGNVSFPSVALADGEQYSVIINNGTGVLTTRTFRVDLVAPTFGGVTFSGGSAAAAGLYVVATTNNRNVETAVAGYVIDGNGALPGGQFTVGVTGVTGAAQYGFDGLLEVSFGGVSIDSTPVTASPQDLSRPQTVGQNLSNTLLVRVTDPAGNFVDVLNKPLTVDTLAPGTPNLGTTPTVLNARAGQVRVQWDPVYDDDGVMASGGVGLEYDLRWSTEILVGTSGIGDAGVYFSSPSLTYREAAIPWQAGPVSQTLTLPPINNYYIAVRARDDVGNYSPYVAPSATLNRGTEDVLLNPTATGSQRFGTVVAGPEVRTGPASVANVKAGIGSVNSDLIDDMALGAYATPIVSDGGSLSPDGGVVPPGSSVASAGAVYVYYGRTNFAATSTCQLPACQLILPYDTVANAQFGTDVAVGNVDSVRNDANARLDLLVGSYRWDGDRGRVMLYFGSQSAAQLDPNTFVELRGAAYGSRLGETTNVLPDLNGDGIDEVLMSASGEPQTGQSDAGMGRFYVFFGRSQASWQAARTGTDAVTGRLYVPVNTTTADRIFEGPLPVDTAGIVSNSLGRSRGVYSPLGDFDGDGRQDFALAANKNTVNTVYFYSGDAGTASTVIPASSNYLRNTDLGTTGQITGFGTRVVGGYDISGSTRPDLVVGHPRTAGGGAPAACYVELYEGNGTGFGPTRVQAIGGPPTLGFGAWVSVLDLNGDGRQDIAVGESGSASSAAWLFYQRAGTTPFDTSTAGGHWQSTFQGPASGRRGISMATGDFDGDGRPDLAVGDDTDAPGRVIVWH